MRYPPAGQAMKQGEVLVALLGKGATVVRYHDETASRVSVALGRNKQARIPHNRVVLATGVLMPEQERFEEFRAGALEQSKEIDLAEVWEVVADDGNPLKLYTQRREPAGDPRRVCVGQLPHQ